MADCSASLIRRQARAPPPVHTESTPARLTAHPQGLALVFIPAWGGTPPHWTPSPPPASAQVHPKTWVLGTFFSHGKKFSAPSAHAIHCVHIA